MAIKYLIRFSILLLTSAFMCSCASTQAKFTLASIKPMMNTMRASVLKNSDFETVRDATPFTLMQLDGFIEVSPYDTSLLIMASETNIGYAFAFIEGKDNEQAEKLYYKAREYALRALKWNKTFSDALEEGNTQEFIKSLKSFSQDDVPALYFAAQSWLSWLRFSKEDNLKDLQKIEAMMDRVLVLDDTFYHGGTHALMGAYLSRPEMFGGKLDEAEFHFKEAFEISDSKFLLWYFLYAKFYATQIKDKELFVTTLNKIISAPDDLAPEDAYVNAIAKYKAKELITHVDEYFTKD